MAIKLERYLCIKCRGCCFRNCSTLL